MYVVVTYDCRDEETRRKVRSILYRYSFTMLTYSVYVGQGSKGLAERLASILSKVLEEGDRATIMLLTNFQYETLMEVTKRNVLVRGEKEPIIVFYGRKRRNENTSTAHESSR
ncbi:MAG: CRISPR-associated endonuclease Cas2 [Thermoprotei archaeon]|nr:MAG: CRISPR-associated endonuclease Cas2 [Thermoprotei archaeon]